MTIEINRASKAAAACCDSIAVPLRVPQFGLQELEAATHKSRAAFRVRAELQAHVERGTLMSRGDVSVLLRSARGRDGRPDANAAAVVAYYARRHPRCFAKDAAGALVKYLDSVEQAEWARLVADLGAFIARLNEQRKEDERLAALKKERDQDDLEHADRKRALVKDNGTKAERVQAARKREAVKAEHKEHLRDLSETDHEGELTASGRVRLSDKELTALQLHNKGFSRS